MDGWMDGRLALLLEERLDGREGHERRGLVIGVVHFEVGVVVPEGVLLGIVVVFEDGEEVVERRCHCTEGKG